MKHFPNRTLLVIAVFTATLLVACGPGSGTATNPTDAIMAIYTTAAQTVAAVYTASAPQSAADQNSSSLTTGSPADLATSTSFPELIFLSPTPILNSAVEAATSSVCDNSTYISDVTIPDNTVVEAGQTFTKTWMLQNTGSCNWDANYTLTFISGDQMGGVNTSDGGDVVSGGQAEVSVNLTAPTAVGTYTGYWQMANDSGSTFGVKVSVVIDVIQDATATPTDTPETPTVSATVANPTAVSTTSVPPTAVATTAVPPTVHSTAVPTTAVPPTAIAATAIPPTAVPTSSK